MLTGKSIEGVKAEMKILRKVLAEALKPELGDLQWKNSKRSPTKSCKIRDTPRSTPSKPTKSSLS